MIKCELDELDVFSNEHFSCSFQFDQLLCISGCAVLGDSVFFWECFNGNGNRLGVDGIFAEVFEVFNSNQLRIIYMIHLGKEPQKCPNLMKFCAK